jgi:hypothetical protein
MILLLFILLFNFSDGIWAWLQTFNSFPNENPLNGINLQCLPKEVCFNILTTFLIINFYKIVEFMIYLSCFEKYQAPGMMEMKRNASGFITETSGVLPELIDWLSVKYNFT